MSRISAATIDRVRESADIVEVVAAAVSLKPRGHEFWACCPFHEERTPSFHVLPDRQYFHCFGCCYFSPLGAMRYMDQPHLIAAIAPKPSSPKTTIGTCQL